MKEALTVPCGEKEAEQAEKGLADKIKSLQLPLPAEEENCPDEKIGLLLEKPIVFSENPRKIQKAVITQEKEDEFQIRMMIDGEEKVCKAGFGRWIRNDLYPGDFCQEFHCLAYAFGKDSLHISVGLINRSYREEYCLCINEEKLVCTWKSNVTYLPAQLDMVWKFSGALDGPIPQAFLPI